MHLPVAFTAELQAQLGSQYTDFEAALSYLPPVSIRYNPAKVSASSRLQIGKSSPLLLAKEKGLGDEVLWHDHAFYLSTRPVFTLDPLFHAGAYYVQEASSMLVAHALAQVADLSKPLRVLDLCAAPGGKTTLLASRLHPDSLLVANEVIKSRVVILKENVQKWGHPNVHICHHDPEDLGRLEAFFDVILIDAPCSGEGLFRKDPAAINEWSPDNVQLCSARQKRILEAALPLLAPKGTLLYCTCTYNDTENQRSLDALTADADFEEQKIKLPESWGVTPKAVGYQCYPHRVRGEGFFFSVFRKKNVPRAAQRYDSLPKKGKEEGFKSCKRLHAKQTAEVARWLEKPDDFHFFIKPNGEVLAFLDSQLDDIRILDNLLFAKGLGLEMGEFKGNDFIPSHALALSTALSSQIPTLELTEGEALQFLKKENLLLDAPKGWLLVTYQELGLGWVKGLGNRLNNYLPKDWRIRMELPE
ncbi:MAG: RsmB/NOP family class I SAM-dependent RNA methyltransferase [Spirosomaceae bacterium]|jgi:16S rRNA C967 or C1407 C5-methylase (RsmB/RsmF family)/NOL1/NOP2/fmu family ribosome biogenesis protein|nr:RsmB/NOP family class I SAM-dependent RNA methyltransferase [Spirosomataceae bacterium]